MRDLLAFLILVSICVSLVFGVPALKTYAAPAAKYQEPGCVSLGTVGAIIIGRCVDESGHVLFANSAGFMAAAP